MAATTIERGIVVDGRVQPGTDFVLRDPAAWWQAGERGTRGRQGVAATVLCGHWTGGPPREGPDAGPRTVRAMRARTRDDGSPLDVGVHFVVSWDGLVWQCADLVVATTHVGHRAINRRSIGVETCWPGLASQADKLEVEGQRVRGWARGAPVLCVAPSDALLDAWVRLAEALARLPAPVGIPRQTGSLAAGAIEHQLVPGTSKVDAAGLLLDALRRHGWQ